MLKCDKENLPGVEENYPVKYWEHQDKILQCTREIGLNSEYSMGNCKCIAKEKGGGLVDEKLLRRNIRDKRILAKWA